jgi:NAD(P)-dependent dehydrogenase (short-subunit alcohol dehydrogenase family)
MSRLSGKTALVTGGNSGIGLATAKAFVNEGAKVIITGRDHASLEAARADLGQHALAYRTDAADLKAIDTLFSELEGCVTGLDILFINAGIGLATPLGQTTEAIFDEVFNTNVKGPFFTVQRAMPLLNRGASIILNASTAILSGAPAMAAYSGSKAAIRTFARNFSAELAHKGIRVNVVSPGPVDTPVWGRTGAPQESVNAVKERRKISIPAGRLGFPEEVAAAVVFLASDDSTFMLGSEVVVDGGATQLPAGAPAYQI